MCFFFCFSFFHFRCCGLSNCRYLLALANKIHYSREQQGRRERGGGRVRGYTCVCVCVCECRQLLLLIVALQLEGERDEDPLVVNPLELLPHLCTPFPLARVPPANLSHVQTVKEIERGRYRQGQREREGSTDC